jgi:vesicle coat complex subunit
MVKLSFYRSKVSLLGGDSMSEESIEKWIKKLSSLDPGEKESASDVIAILAPVRAREIIQYDGLPPLIACLKDDSENVRKNAILAISCIVAKGEGAVVVKSGALEHLVNCLTDKNALVREKTAWAFKELAGVGEVEAIIRSGALRNLVTSLTDTNPEVRRWSVATMGRIAERGWAKVIVQCGGVEKLIKCLKDDDSKIRSESAGAIGLIAKHGEAKNIIETDALMELVNCLSDKSTDVRKDARRRFQTMGDVRKNIESTSRRSKNKQRDIGRVKNEKTMECSSQRFVASLLASPLARSYNGGHTATVLHASVQMLGFTSHFVSPQPLDEIRLGKYEIMR